MSNMGNSVCHYDWCYVSGRVNILECSLLSSNFFERLLSTNDFEDVLASLNNTPLKAYFTHAKHLYEFEKLLDEYCYNRLDKIRGASVDKYFRGTMSRDEWDDVWQEKATSLPEIFKESISFFKSVINRISKESIPFVIDMIFDGAYLRYMG